MTHPLPALTDHSAEMQRLALEEKRLSRTLAQLEESIRRFEDFERPAYEAWIQVELGPMLAMLDELHQQIYESRLKAQRWAEREQIIEKGKPDPSAEVRARRQAKLEAKREARKQKQKAEKLEKKAATETTTPSSPERRSLVSLYRSLARLLHPDSPDKIKTLPPPRALSIWMEAQNAYASRDTDRLLALLSWLDQNQHAVENRPHALTYRERRARVKALERSCHHLAKKIAQLEQNPAWRFESTSKTTRRKIRELAAQEIQDEIERTQDVFNQLKKFLAMTQARRSNPGKTVPNSAHSRRRSRS